MTNTYSTLHRDMARGKVYSSQHSGRVTVLPSGQIRTPVTGGQPAVASVTPAAAQPAPAPQVQPVTFDLKNPGPAAKLVAPNGAGTVQVTRMQNGSASVTSRIIGVNPIKDPANRPALWLIHDLAVPQDLSPADLAQLPRGSAGTGNRPGAPFTIDGNPPTYGTKSNTVAIAISPGSYSLTPDGTWQLTGMVDAGTNQAFHPLVVLGPEALADINAALPTGTVARILTDLFMRPATVHPELPLSTHYQQRLSAVVGDVLGRREPPSYLAPEAFTRAAVTLEGLVRNTSRLMPTRETCFLLS